MFCTVCSVPFSYAICCSGMLSSVLLCCCLSVCYVLSCSVLLLWLRSVLVGSVLCVLCCGFLGSVLFGSVMLVYIMLSSDLAGSLPFCDVIRSRSVGRQSAAAHCSTRFHRGGRPGWERGGGSKGVPHRGCGGGRSGLPSWPHLQWPKVTVNGSHDTLLNPV